MTKCVVGPQGGSGRIRQMLLLPRYLSQGDPWVFICPRGLTTHDLVLLSAERATCHPIPVVLRRPRGRH
jgi:hypothetical protein